MLELIEINRDHINSFEETEYQNLNTERRRELIESSIKGSVGGKFFKFYLIMVDGVCVGFINMCGHTDSVISVSPEIKVEYRQKGYAYTAMKIALNYAKGKGYKIAIADVREENEASCNLQQKLGFEYVKNYLTKNGNAVKLYVKAL